MFKVLCDVNDRRVDITRDGFNERGLVGLGWHKMIGRRPDADTTPLLTLKVQVIDLRGIVGLGWCGSI